MTELERSQTVCPPLLVLLLAWPLPCFVNQARSIGQEQNVMTEPLLFNAMRKTDARNAASEQGYNLTEQCQHAAERTSEHRKCGLDTGARGWRYVYQTH